MANDAIDIFDGFGLGLRPPHFNDYLTRDIGVDFVEIISENFMIEGGRPLHVLDGVRERHPVVMHGVSMSVGSAEGLNLDYLKRLKALVKRARPLFVSDHLCWTGAAGFNSHDLLPMRAPAALGKSFDLSRLFRRADDRVGVSRRFVRARRLLSSS